MIKGNKKQKIQGQSSVPSTSSELVRLFRIGLNPDLFEDALAQLKIIYNFEDDKEQTVAIASARFKKLFYKKHKLLIDLLNSKDKHTFELGFSILLHLLPAAGVKNANSENFDLLKILEKIVKENDANALVKEKAKEVVIKLSVINDCLKCFTDEINIKIDSLQNLLYNNDSDKIVDDKNTIQQVLNNTYSQADIKKLDSTTQTWNSTIKQNESTIYSVKLNENQVINFQKSNIDIWQALSTNPSDFYTTLEYIKSHHRINPSIGAIMDYARIKNLNICIWEIGEDNMLATTNKNIQADYMPNNTVHFLKEGGIITELKMLSTPVLYNKPST